MAFETISPNMNLTIPGVALTGSPAWAEDLNNSLSLIDSHNHSNGQGVQITPEGIDINAEFPMNGNDITDARSVRFASQGSPLSLPSDLGCIYVSGADLYYNDTAGNQVRITQSGAVVGTPGSITALAAPASATYVAGNGTFVWQQAVNTAANMDMASAIIRKTTASSAGITIAAPVGLSVDYTMSLPSAPPAQTTLLAMDPSGNLTLNSPANNQVSSSCGVFTIVDADGITDVTNLSVTISANGRPILLALQGIAGGGGGGDSALLAFGQDPGNVSCRANMYLVRGASTIQTYTYDMTINSVTGVGLLEIPPGFLMIDVPSAGSQTYKIQLQSAGGFGASVTLKNYVLVAYQL